METKEMEPEKIKPVPVNSDEEIGEGRLDNAEIKEEGEGNENVEYSYESHRSPFPEGMLGDC